MKRRRFVKMIAGTAAAAALPLGARRGFAESGMTAFGGIGQTYARFCATPEMRRVFRTLRGRNIVMERLTGSGWRPTEWGHPPALPVPGGSWDGVPLTAPIAGLAGRGPFQPTWDSLLQYECPEWYQDAKFGIWNHWSPQCVPEDGDWYGRNMYIQGAPAYGSQIEQYDYQLTHYGHPSRFGYKDLCAQWTLLDWRPEELVDLYVRAGAKLFLALANHHDGFDTWSSAHHPWNARNIGPHRDVIGTWAQAVRRRGLRFGVTVHQARNWWWFQPAHGADAAGPYAGVPYDGHLTMADGKGQWWEGYDPQRLYGPKHPFDALPDISYVKNFYDRTRDLIDQHDPDLLYFDNDLLPLGWGGMCLGAYFYNRSQNRQGGKVGGVITGKHVPDRLQKALVADIERGLSGDILKHPWQSETCIGNWHYLRTLYEAPGEFGGYMHPRDAIHWLIDTVSKNGTFILNVPGKPDGTIDGKERLILERIGAWLAVNGEAIYATRPWKVYGEGPNVIRAGSFQGTSIAQLSAKDIRFTRNKSGTVVYVMALGWPQEPMLIRSLGTAAATQPGAIAQVELLGTQAKPPWRQIAAGLQVDLRKIEPAVDYAMALRVHLAR
ncbi:MAG: alpha-L-fucosidase [Gammaproteobacteria bacterium]|nr:alpha-L-fucosidase [Gammaproteobacteria bacterium]